MAALPSAARRPGRRLIALGSGAGERDRTKRPFMGLAASTADVVVVTVDQPRSEDPARLAAEVYQGVPSHVEAHVIPDRREAIAFAVSAARPGDVVVLTGKGHHLTQCIGTETSHFDERQIVREALAARSVAARAACPGGARRAPADRPRAAALEHRSGAGVRVLTDAEARERGVLVAFGDRRGGVSSAPYDELNLAMKGGDCVADVVENRSRIGAAAGFDPLAISVARQVHGTFLERVEPGRTNHGGVADGMVTSVPGMVLGLLTADCGAVVLAGDRGVAILHAGWRGLAQGIVAAGVAAVGPVWRAWVGPSIRDCCYEVGTEVIDAFRAQDLPVGPGRIDIADAAGAALRAAGVEQVLVADVCTGCDPDYFSYRRERLTGRQGAFVAILGA